MPISKLTTSLLLVAMTPMAAFAENEETPWQGSYAANGQCFCVGQVSETIASKIVPTPIGGQTVGQVCAKVGGGPGLSIKDGLFNYTVYNDMQCGHGPFASSSSVRDADCLGSIDGTYGSCQPAGPNWALDVAYGDKAILAAAVPEQNEKISNTSLSVVGKQLPSGTRSTTSIQLASDATTQEADQLATFTGKSIMLGEDRYLQARDDLSPNGGVAGSRIILDGVVFLKDDENLVLSDLYTTPDVSQEPEKTVSDNTAAVTEEQPEIAVTAPQSSLPAVSTQAQVASDKSVEQQFLDDMRAKREALAREQEQLLQKSQLAEQQRLADRAAADRAAQNKQLAEKEAAERKKLADLEADKRKRLAEQKTAEQERFAKQQATIEKQQAARQDELEASEIARDSVTETQVPEPAQDSENESPIPSLAAAMSVMRLPASVRASTRNFNYFEAMPTSYDFGGAGIRLEGSLQRNSKFQFLANVGRSETYGEVMIGAGYFLTPEAASRMTVVLLAGVESGSFELTDEAVAPGVTVTSGDSGVYLGALSRVVINSKFELKGGLGYSSFFGGDATVFGGGYYHVTPRLDIMSRFELGDNDHLGLGIRYYY